MNPEELKLRIAQVVRSDAFAGVERYVCGVANELTIRGHEIHVVGGAPGRMREELDESVDYTPAASSRAVLRALRRLGPLDVVHAHMTAAECASILTRQAHRAPVVSTRHFPDRRLGSLPPLAGRRIGRRLAAQIAISDFVARGIGEPSVVIHNGVSPREQARLESPVVLMLQRLQPEKAPFDALEAWKASGLAESGWTLVVAGSGDLEHDLRQHAAGMAGVSFVGSVSQTDELLGGTSVFLAPAPAEPFGLSVVEAMAHGVPVVAARGGAHAETLGGDGAFFEPGDTREAGRLLAEFAADQGVRLVTGARLRARQQASFSLDAHDSQLQVIYCSVV